MDMARRMVGLPEKRESLELNVDDKRLMELLGVDVGDVNVRGKNALKIDVVHACVRIRSESVAKLPLKVYQEDESGVQKATRHPVYQLLKLRPNQYMSAFDFWKCVEAQNCMYGNAYVSIEFDKRNGAVIGLWPLDASKVKVVVDDDSGLSNIAQPRTRLWYVVDLGHEKRKLAPDEVLHFKGGITLDGLVGIPPLDYLRATIENAAAATKFINNFFKQGLQVKGLIQYVGDLNEPAKKNFREKFEEMSSGLKNSHRIALMPVGYQFTPMSLSMADAQFLENTQMTIRAIATAFGIKMHQINDLARATHSNVAEQQKEFYTETLQSSLTMYEQESTFKLLLDWEITEGFYLRFNVDAILRGDLKSRYEAYRIGVQGGFLSPNEARAKEELSPKDGGDQLLVNGSYVPITEAGKAYALKGGDGTGKGEKDDPDEGDPGASGKA
ncbi:phage portal protein [Cohnella yongneupensis]|uniref:Phage portal protein n=1 Tax=Cohnella yongneupensis TaxID=425006 RepID=A0ABW0R944_9BACL